MSIVKSSIFEPYIPSSYDKIEHQNNFLYHSYNHSKEGDIYFTENEKKDYEKLVNSLLNQKVNTTLNGKIYLGKLSSLPRHKIKDYFKENKVSKTSRLDQSDTIILNKEHLVEFNKMFESGSSWYRLKPCKIYRFDSEHDKEYIENYSKSYYNGNIIHDEPFTIMIREDNKNLITPKLVNFLQGKKSEDVFYKNLYREKNLVEVHNYLEYILKNPNVKVIFDENIMDPLNEDGFELDEEYLTTLDGMFESKSQDNINLALEMLSNVNIEKNSLTIALFLNKHKNIFSWGSGLSITKNNSFKSTLKYFKSKNINLESDWRIFSTSLLKLHKDNPKNVDIIKDFTLQNINIYLKQFGSDGKGFIELTSFDLALKD
jgi:hypothetical protein